MKDILHETIKSLLGESAPKRTNEESIRAIIDNTEFLESINVKPIDIIDQVKIAEKDYKDIVKYVSEYKDSFGSLYKELGGWNLQDEDTTQIVDNLFDCYYGCLLITVKVNYGKLSVSPKDVYVYPKNITTVDSDELFHLDLGVPIDYSKFADILPENNTVKEEANKVQEAKNEDLGEVVKIFKSDDNLGVKIVKAPNGRFFNEYYSDINDAHYSGTSGPFKSVKDAEKMVHKHRPTVKEINITESEEVSKDGKSCRHAINENATVVKEDDTIPVEFPEAKTNEIKDMMRAKMDNKESKVQESVDINANLKDMSDEDLDALLMDTIDEREGVDDDSERAEELDNFYMELDSEIRSRQNCKSARCIKSYDEDGDEYWSEGNYYTVCQLDNDTWTVRNNFDGVSKIGPDYTVDDFDEYFVLEEAKVIKQPKSEEEKIYDMVKQNYGKKAADEWYQFNSVTRDSDKTYKGKKVKTEAPEQDSDEYIRLCTEIEFQAEDNGFTLTNDDVKAIADKMVADKFFFNHDIFADDDDEKAWEEINSLIIANIEAYPNKITEGILSDLGSKREYNMSAKNINNK